MDKKFFVVGIFISIVLFLICSVLAAPTSVPSDLDFNLNITAIYDEGNFSLNWTGGTLTNFTIYIFADNTLYKKAWNDSETGYSFNNWTEANYTFKVAEVYIANATEGTNSSNISIYVDRTVPVITLPVYLNGTAKKNTGSLTLNISVIDASSGEEGSVCLIDVNGTSNQSIAVSNGWCNSTVINLTGSSDGNHTLNVYVNDTVNIFGLNNSFVIQVDTTVPVPSFSCSPREVYAAETITCTCTATDTIDSNPSISYTAHPLTSSTGTHTTTCTVTDFSSNSATSTISYIVGIIKGSSGEVSSTTNKLIEQKIHSWSKITPGTATVMENIDGDMGVKQISVEVKNEAENVKIIVTKHESKPAEVSLEKTGKVYRYFQIEATNLNDKLEKATITIQVEKIWMSNNRFDKDNLALSKFDETNSRWNELTTTYMEEDDTYYYYDIELTSFSYFAISSKAKVEEELSETGESEISEEEKMDLTWLWIVIGILVLVVIIGGGIVVKKKTKQ
jgi:PGF-pre-PGF domain-containing protein